MMAGDTVVQSEISTPLYHERTADLLVTEKETVAEGVVALTLRGPAGDELPDWTPGAHIDVLLTEPDLVRQYSLCGSPQDRHQWRVAVLKEPSSRGGSSYIHENLAPGAAMRVRGPRNHFPFIEASEYLFVAGGIGITPLLPMLHAAEAADVKWQLVYGGRSRSSMAFLDELEQYGPRVRVLPQDELGLLPLGMFLSTPRPGMLVYGCGPEALLDALEAHCAPWPAGSLHTERFKAKEIEPTAGALESFEVSCQRSGITFTVPADRSVLDVGNEHGLGILSSCREGVCGTCEVGVIEGDLEHRDSVLSEEERAAGEFMMTCVSRSLSPRLVLDI